jgi:hypothetical protein
MSYRTTIIDAIMAVIVTANVSSTRVSRGRANVIPDGSYPHTYVYPVREEIESLTTRLPARFLHRTLTVAVDHFARAATPELLEEAFDTAASSIETAIHAVATGSQLRDVVLTTCEWLYEGVEDQPTGCVRLTFVVTAQA